MFDLHNTDHDPPINIDEKQLLHRILNSIPLHGDIKEIASKIDKNLLTKIQCYYKTKESDYLHEDVCGLMIINKFLEACILCRQLYNISIDALLRSKGNTNSTEKWRSKIIQNILPDLFSVWIKYQSLPDCDNQNDLQKFAESMIRDSEFNIILAQEGFN